MHVAPSRAVERGMLRHVDHIGKIGQAASRVDAGAIARLCPKSRRLPSLELLDVEPTHLFEAKG